MARFRLSTDILSPVHSDISLNDISAFSFGSLSGTPDYDKDNESPIYKCTEKDSDIDSFCKRTMKESANAFEMIVNDIKRQSNINAEKEEKFKESYEILKQSMDELLHSKDSNSSIPTTISKNVKLKKSQQGCSDSKIGEVAGNSQKFNVCKKAAIPELGICSKVSSTKSERNKKSSSINREKENIHQPKNIQPLKLPVDNSRFKNEICLGNDVDTNSDALFDNHEVKISETAPISTQTSRSKRTTSKETCDKSEVQRNQTVKGFQFKSQQKIPVSNIIPAIENKGLSLEKSIKIAVSMELDNIRRLMLEQKLSLNKELLKLQETVRKQNEVTEYLFSVTDELFETNKKLLSQCFKVYI